MRFNRMVRPLFLCLIIVGLSQAAFAQKFEIDVYGGGFWPMKIDEFKFRNQGMWGLRGGYFLSDKVQVEGNFGYLNHFEFDTDNLGETVFINNITVVTVLPGGDVVGVTELNPSNVTIIEPSAKQRGYLWEFNGSYHFFGSRLGGTKFTPYLTLGLGGTNVTRSDAEGGQIIINQPNLTQDELNALRQVLDQRIVDARALLSFPINTGTYFTINYGGGFKAFRLWGPVGLRADLLGRNLPNFDGKALNAFQLTGGVNFSWGER